MAHDITKDVIGCKEFEVQKLNQSGEPAKFFGSITEDEHLVTKKYVDDNSGGGGITNLDGGRSDANFGGVAISPIDGGDST